MNEKTAEWYFGTFLSWIAAATVSIKEGVKKVGKIEENFLNMNPNVTFGQKTSDCQGQKQENFPKFYQFFLTPSLSLVHVNFDETLSLSLRIRHIVHQ